MTSTIERIRVTDRVTTPEGEGVVVEFDPNHYGGRDVMVLLDSGYRVWFYKSELRRYA